MRDHAGMGRDVRGLVRSPLRLAPSTEEWLARALADAEPDTLLSVTQTSRVLGVGLGTVRRRIATGTLAAQRNHAGHLRVRLEDALAQRQHPTP